MMYGHMKEKKSYTSFVIHLPEDGNKAGRNM